MHKYIKYGIHNYIFIPSVGQNVLILNDFPHLLQENVDCDFEFVTTSPSAMVSLIDKPSQQSLVSYLPSRYYTNTRIYYALWQVFMIVTEYCLSLIIDKK